VLGRDLSAHLALQAGPVCLNWGHAVVFPFAAILREFCWSSRACTWKFTRKCSLCGLLLLVRSWSGAGFSAANGTLLLIAHAGVSSRCCSRGCTAAYDQAVVCIM
jgi:hypothetical protein